MPTSIASASGFCYRVSVVTLTQSKNIYYLFIGSWFFLVLLWPKPSNVSSVLTDADEPQSGEGLYKSKITDANFGLLGVDFFESNDGVKRWHIRSKFAELHRKDNYAYLQQVTTEFFAEKTGNVVFTKSDYGRSWTDKNYVELEGNVSIQSKRGYLFTMNRLNYDGNTHEFYTDDIVNMRGPIVEKPTMLLKGSGLVADIDREHFILKKNVSGHKKLKKSDWLRITSKTGEFFTDESRAVFVDRVRAIMPKTTIESDVFEISGSHERESLEARGSVLLKSKDRIGRAEKALLEVGGDQIILEGKARVDSKGNTVMGRRIILYSEDDRIEVQEAEGKSIRP